MRLGRLCSIVVLVIAACCLVVRGQQPPCCRRVKGCNFPPGCHCPLKMSFCGDPSHGLQIVGKKSDTSYAGEYSTRNQQIYDYHPADRDYVKHDRHSRNRRKLEKLVRSNKLELSDVLKALQRGNGLPWSTGQSP